MKKHFLTVAVFLIITVNIFAQDSSFRVKYYYDIPIVYEVFVGSNESFQNQLNTAINILLRETALTRSDIDSFLRRNPTTKSYQNQEVAGLISFDYYSNYTELRVMIRDGNIYYVSVGQFIPSNNPSRPSQRRYNVTDREY